MKWIEAVSRLGRENTGFVIATVIDVQGSAPRDTKSKMVVTADRIHDSIGGGNLEFEVLQIARGLLTQDRASVIQQQFSLGQDLNQCCGGRVTILFECFPACQFNIALFGAGHVGRALSTILGELPCRVSWIDSRSNIFPEQIPFNTETTIMENPFEAVERCPQDAYYLIMTHSHEIDIEICEAVLGRNDIRFCGLIGSKSKSARFRSRLRKKGFSERELKKLTSPIGLESVPGKTPMEVAVSVAGQLLALHHRRVTAQHHDVDENSSDRVVDFNNKASST